MFYLLIIIPMTKVRDAELKKFVLVKTKEVKEETKEETKEVKKTK